MSTPDMRSSEDVSLETREKLKRFGDQNKIGSFFSDGIYVGGAFDDLPDLVSWKKTAKNMYDYVGPTKEVHLMDGRVLTNETEIHEYAKMVFIDTSDERTAHTADAFWGRFHDLYKKRLDEYIEQLPPIESHIDAIVLITARNESHIEQVIQSVRKSNKTKNIQFIVVNNFKEREENTDLHKAIMDYMRALHVVEKFTQIDEQLPDFSNVGFAKKIAIETVIRRMSMDGRFLPIVSLDADIVDIDTEDFISAGIDVLNKHEALVVTSDFDYSKKSQMKYPAWGLRCALLKKIRGMTSSKKAGERTPLIGANFIIHPNTYMLVGGYDPQYGEDKALAKKLRDACKYESVMFDPIESNGTVYLDPTKELENLSKGELAEREWFNPDLFNTSHDTFRYDWEEVIDLDVGIFSPTLTTNAKKAALLSTYEYLLNFFTGSRLSSQAYSTKVLMLALIESPDACKDLTFKMDDGSVLRSHDDIASFVAKYDLTKETHIGQISDQMPTLKKIDASNEGIFRGKLRALFSGKRKWS